MEHDLFELLAIGQKYRNLHIVGYEDQLRINVSCHKNSNPSFEWNFILI